MGEEILVFYNDHSSFASLLEMMQSERERSEESSPLLYHISLVRLLASCTEGKNVYTEIKCHSLLPLDDIVRIVTHPDCIPEVICLSIVLSFGLKKLNQIVFISTALVHISTFTSMLQV